MPIKTQQDEPLSLNMTPMIDIVFLLIIFFMVGTQFVELERNMKLEVPQVSDLRALTPTPARQVVNVYQDGTIMLDNQQVTLDELKTRLSRARTDYKELGVVVRGDAGGRFQNVASVLAACRNAGISDMGISVRLASRE